MVTDGRPEPFLAIFSQMPPRSPMLADIQASRSAASVKVLISTPPRVSGASGVPEGVPEVSSMGRQ